MSVQDALNIQGTVLTFAAVIVAIVGAAASVSDNPRLFMPIFIAAGAVGVIAVASFIAAAWSAVSA